MKYNRALCCLCSENNFNNTFCIRVNTIVTTFKHFYNIHQRFLILTIRLYPKVCMSFDKGAEGSRPREQTRGEGQEYGGSFGQLPDKEI